MPAREIFVTGGEEGKTTRDINFIWGQREAEICLGEGGDGGAKQGGELLRGLRGNYNWKKSSFMIINGETSSLFEELKDMPGL
jgi:hypothetical protein